MQTNLPAVPLNRGDEFSTPFIFVIPLKKVNQLFNSGKSNASFSFKPLALFSLLAMIFFVSGIQKSFGQITYTWNGGGTSTAWNLPANWAKTSGTSYPGTASTDIVSIPTNASSKYPDLSSVNYTIGKISSMGNNAVLNGTGTLTINGSGQINIASGVTALINCPVNINANTTFFIQGTSKLTIAGSLTGTGGITKTGTGDLQLATVSIVNLTNSTTAGSTITLGGPTKVNGMLTLSTGILYIGGNTLTLSGGITQTGGFLSGKSTSNLTLVGNVGNEVLTFEANREELNTLVINHTTLANSTTKLNSSLTLYGGVQFGGTKDILDLNNQHLTLKSDASATAYVGEIKGALNNANNVTVERYIDGTADFTFKRAWRLLSFPVTGQTIRDAWAGGAANASAPDGEVNNYVGTLITGHGYADGNLAAGAGYDWFAGLAANTTSSIRYYDVAHGWASATNTPTTLSTPDKQGYMLYVRGDRSVATAVDYGYTVLRPTGTLKQGTQTIQVDEAYTVIGNPYASPINLESVYNNSGNNAVINHNFWIWDATQGTGGGYRLLAWNGGSYDMSGGAGNATDYLIANSGQAFFVEKKATGSITINESNKTTLSAPAVFRPMSPAGVSKIGVKLYQATGSTLGVESDGVLARYNDIYSVSPFESYDAPKLNNFNENLSLVRSGRYLSIESRPFPTSNDTLFIPFWGLTKRDYALTITSSLFTGLNQSASLFDAFTNTSKLIDMNGGTVIYPFSITSDPASSSLNRFTIVMVPAQFGVLPVTFTKVNAMRKGSDVQVDWSTGSEAGIKEYDVEKSTDGTHFRKINSVAAMNSAQGGSYTIIDNQPVNGNNFYRIRSNDESGKINYSSIAVVELNGKKGIQVTPTLINNQQFTIALNGSTAGDYKIALTNLSGQQVLSTTISSAGGNIAQVIHFQKEISSGIYHLTVTGNDGSLQNFRLLIQN